ncbi:hypothetical protein B5F40_02955 [Gordonibacter sp. An230]|uniref:glycosyltransferase family 2 protein n=1 Tax=Gordonibacter sp. An230 TaxID=1965592 RepID=UPI000B36C5A1|nr:glycosyltransferase [Gordonibacter sp. An230]OUO91807.1 hypothetical protein B5F40_02955 [Gordonibacter sp. An230]
MAGFGNNELVSIVSPLHNTDPLLVGMMLNSVVCQTYDKWELIMIDDGSDGDFYEKYNSLIEEEPRFKLHRMVHAGVSAARNVGMGLAKGQYLTFVDSDDELPRFSLSSLVQAACDFDADCVISPLRVIGKRGSRITGRLSGDDKQFDGRFAMESLFLKRVSESSCGKLYKRSVVEGVRFDENLKVCEDALFVFSVFEQASRCCYIETPCYQYRNRSGSSTKSGFSEKFFDAVVAAERMLESESIINGDTSLKNQAHAYRYSKCVDCVRSMIRDRSYCALNPSKAEEVIQSLLSQKEQGYPRDRLEALLAAKAPLLYSILLRQFDRIFRK